MNILDNLQEQNVTQRPRAFQPSQESEKSVLVFDPQTGKLKLTKKNARRQMKIGGKS